MDVKGLARKFQINLVTEQRFCYRFFGEFDNFKKLVEHLFPQGVWNEWRDKDSSSQDYTKSGSSYIINRLFVVSYLHSHSFGDIDKDFLAKLD